MVRASLVACITGDLWANLIDLDRTPGALLVTIFALGAMALIYRRAQIADKSRLMYDVVSDRLTEVLTYIEGRHVKGYGAVETVKQHARRRRKVIGANIKLARRLAGISQASLARMLNVPRPQLSDWERGVHEPREYMPRIVAALSVSEKFLTTEHSPDEIDAMLDGLHSEGTDG